MEEWSSLCRCCLSTGSKTSLLQDEDVRAKFYETTSIEVNEEDGLPQRLCEDCLGVMNSAHQFKKQCLRIDSELKLQLLDLAQTEEEQRPMEASTAKLPGQQEQDEAEDEVPLYPEVIIKSEPPESDDDCYYVLVIDDNSKEASDAKVKTELKELNPATGELGFEKSVDAFLVMKPQDKEAGETGVGMQDKDGQQYRFSEGGGSNDSDENSQMELASNIDMSNAGLLSNGDSSNIIKILTSNGLTENILFKGDRGDEIVTYIVDNQLVAGDADGLSQEEVIVCEGDDSQFQIVDYDGSDLVIEYTNDGQISSASMKSREDGALICSCGLQFADFDQFENHQAIHHASSDESHLCGLCGKGFESHEILTGHMQLHTNSGATIQCPYCRQHVKRNSITQHIKFSHNNIKPRCNLCQKTFANPNNLKRHMMIHSGVRQYECDICQKRFHQKITMQTHRLTHVVDPLLCRPCDVRFDSAVQLAAHQEQHECESAADALEVKNLKGKTLCYPCPMCNKLFSVESALKYHIDSAHGSDTVEYLCSECGEVLPNRKAMCTHSNGHKLEIFPKLGRRFECKRCGKTCSSQAMLIMHERVHTNERPFQCPLCALRFKTKTHLRTHHLTHTREKRFGCSVCMKFFALKGNLVVHLRTHTGERPYVCSLCNDAFIDSKYLKKHKLKKHSIGNVPWNQY